MENEIKVKKVTEDTILIGLLDEGETYDFCMCNPPFYSDHLEAQGITSSRSDGRSDSSSVSTASEAESIAWGGEVRFVSQMIEESLKLKDRVRLFTSLLGKKTSLSLLKDVLSRNKIDKYSTTEFCQGRTMRWGIAWTFDENIKFPKSFFREKKNEKPPITQVLSRESSLVVGDYTVQAFTWFMWKQLEELKIYFHVYHSGKFYSCFSMKCMKNTWSHQRRKKRQQQREHGTTQTADTVEQTAENIVDTSVESKNESTEAVVEVDTRNDTTSDIVSDTSASANVNNMTEIPVEKNIEKVETRKRLAEDSDSECLAKKSRIERKDNNVTDDSNEITTSEGDDDVNKESLNNDKLATDNSNEMKTSEVVSDVNIESMNNDKPVTDSSNEMKTSEGDHDVNKESGNKDKSNTLNRKEIIEQFWKEQEENSGKSGAGKKKVASSFYECLEPFKTDDECLLMCKVVLRKEEGVISLTLTHLAGNKEAMHQIKQFFKNKFTVQKK
ncbi:Methyltransferase-like protein 16 [Mactra antiquata]